MSVMETRLAGRRAAARNAAETRKKLLLGGLVVVLVGLLVFELPKLLKSSSSSSSTASTSVTTAPAPAAATGNLTPATKASAARARVIHRMPARNPFVPLIHESASAPSAPSPAPAAAPAPVATQPSVPFTPSTVAPAPPAPTTPEVTKPVTKPVHLKPAAPTAAVIWTNGRRQLVGLSQVFKIGEVRFLLVGVTPKAVRIRIVGGAFAGGKQTITARKGHRVKLTNTATGVEYGLLFTAGTADAPATSTSAGTSS